tara:strand:- start:104 stop:1723 length:1620 start_codon:yes stop_codon:yes gene_type:complete
MVYVQVAPNWGKLIESLRYVGYNNYDAIKDLIDNSIDADSDTVFVNIKQASNNSFNAPRLSNKKKKSIANITIADNGSGMHADQLIEAMKLGSESEYNAASLGKFGMGLITASISMGRRLTVVTKTEESDEINVATLDLDVIVESGEMKIAHKQVTLEELGENFFGKQVFETYNRGTVVKIDKLDQVTCVDAAQMAKNLRGASHLARTFRFFIEEEGINIRVNGRPVEAYDVLDWANVGGSTIALTSGWETLTYDGHEFKYRATFQYPRTDGSGGGVERKRSGTQGISLIRARREIEFGKTYGFYANRTNFAGFQTELMLPSVLVDKFVGITFSKSGASKKNEFIDQAFYDFVATNVINPLKKAAGKIFQKELNTSTFENLDKEHLDHAKRLQKISDILKGLPDRKKRSKASKATEVEKAPAAKAKKKNSTSRKYGRKDIDYKFSLTEGWHGNDVLLDYEEDKSENGATCINIILNAKHRHVRNNYIAAETTALRDLQRKWFTAIALMLRGMSEEEEDIYRKFFDDMCRNLDSLESTRF